MSGLLAADWLKLRKRLMPRVLLGIMLAIIALIFFGVARQNDTQTVRDIFLPDSWLLGLAYASFFAPFIAPILAGSWAGSEYSWGTIRMILSRRPGRDQFLLSGIIVLLLGAAFALLATLVLATLAGWLSASLMSHSAFSSSALTNDFWGTLVKLFLGVWLVMAFYVVLAYSAGTLFRSGAVGIGVGVGLTLADLILTGIFTGLGGTWRQIADHFPDVYARTLPLKIAEHQVSSLDTGRADLPSISTSIVGLGIYTLVPLAIALLLIRYRDVTA
ncbi:MAG TPA: ABC transporter permease [Chloroflexota bacterium]